MKARCLCDAVEIDAHNNSVKVEACHCAMCRKWGGGPLLVIACGDEVTINGEDHVSLHPSSDWAERGFCRRCGTHLFYRLSDSKQYMVPAGLFDEQGEFVFEEQIFIDKKPGYYSFANATHNLTEAQVFEKFAPGTES